MPFRISPASLSLALALLLATLAPAGLAQAMRDPVTLNFVDADIGAVARTFASILGREVVVDPRVKGTITLQTDKPLLPTVAFERFVETLRLSGYAVVDGAGVLKLVPEADAKLQSDSVSQQPLPGANQVATQIFKLQFENATNLVPVLRPLVSPNNIISAIAGSNALVVTDYAANLQRLGKIIAAVDVPNVTGVELVALRHALAADLAPVVQRMLDASSSSTVGSAATGAAQPAAEGGFRTTVAAETRGNALVIRAGNAARIQLARDIVERLDQPSPEGPAGNIHVVYLRNAEATRLATVLRAALSPTGGSGTTVPASGTPVTTAATGAGAASSSSASNTTPVQPTAPPSTGGQIQADPATNSLVISAAEPQYRQLRAVIEQLDGRRAQVLVESLIVEISADKAAEFSVQWQNILGTTSSSVVGYLGTNYSVGGSNIISLNTGLASGTTLPSTGFNFGVGRKIDGSYVLGALARFFESSGDGNVLSTPTLLTMDNEEAKIVVGQNVPFVTGQYASTGSTSTSSSVNPFQTIERKDVGLTLRVKPQINENGAVRLTIYQEVSSVQASTASNSNGPTTNKRSIESNVLVQDGAVVVLGGLMQDEYAGNEEKVPGLSAVPVLGNLFRSEARSRKKTNLVVFLRPVVMRDAAQTQALSMDRYQMMRAAQQAAQPEASMLAPLQGAPVLPAASDSGR